MKADEVWPFMLLAAAAKSGDPGTIRLAAQLGDVVPCERCDYRKEFCRCSATDGVAASAKTADGGM